MFEANPVIQRVSKESSGSGTLTYDGVVHRTGFLLLLASVAFALSWRGLESGALPAAAGLGGLIIGVILALVISFSRSSNPFLIGAYALSEGVGLGVISSFVNARYPGIALQAVAGTMACFLGVLCLYGAKVLRATPLFTKVITAAILGIGLLYLTDMIAGLFGHPLAIIHGSSMFSIGISVVVVLVASLAFVIDFAAIESAIADGVEASEGWRFGFALLVGLVWLYVEMLSLLMKLRSRD